MMTRRDALLRYAAATLLTHANDEPARRLQHEREAYQLYQDIPVAYRAELERLTGEEVLALAAATLGLRRGGRRTPVGVLESALTGFADRH